MQITDETIEYVGILAKLELSPEEKERAKKDMSEMLDYVGKLNELDVSGVEPMSHTFPVSNVMRETSSDVSRTVRTHKRLRRLCPTEGRVCERFP